MTLVAGNDLPWMSENCTLMKAYYPMDPRIQAAARKCTERVQVGGSQVSSQEGKLGSIGLDHG